MPIWYRTGTGTCKVHVQRIAILLRKECQIFFLAQARIVPVPYVRTNEIM